MPEKPKRRWLQYRLTTWFPVVVIVAMSITLWQQHRRSESSRARADFYKMIIGKQNRENEWLQKDNERLQEELRDVTSGS